MTDTGPDGDLIARLAAHKAIGNVPRAELEWLVAHGTLERYQTGDTIARKGQQVEAMYIILEGHVAHVLEQGASWLPGFMRNLDAAYGAFRKNEVRLQELSAPPSEIVRRQVRVTPYPHEDTGWIIEQSGPEMCLFSSDYPHVEGGRNPLKRFNESLEGVSPTARRKFFRDNFVRMMGQGLAADLHDIPGLAAA